MREILESYLALFDGAISTASYIEKCHGVACKKRQWEITSENLVLEISTYRHDGNTLQEMKVSLNEDSDVEDEDFCDKEFLALTRWSGFGFKASDVFSLLQDPGEIKIEGHVPEGLKENDLVALPSWAIALHALNVLRIGTDAKHSFIERTADGKKTLISPFAVAVPFEEQSEFVPVVFHCNDYVHITQA